MMARLDHNEIAASRVNGAEGIAACQEIMQRVFHEELGFSGMNFPDSFETNSVYVELRICNELAGAFRIVKPNESNHCPATEAWPGAHKLEQESVCQFSRVAVLPEYRRRGLFRVAVGFVAETAREFGVSQVISEVLTEKQSIYANCGFGVVGQAFCDPTIDVQQTGVNNCIPMILQVD